ncbi:MAG: efflux RND transporter periplasmic adaptor subunit [Treponema sp.]|nr:efflux RND transporter periplasmic adaptor subunit [Treponema sp.]
MKHTKTSKRVTIVISGLTGIFVLLIGWTVIQRRPPATPSAAGPGAAAPASAGGGPGATAPTPAGGEAGRGGGAARNATAVRVTPVTLDTIENSVVINGDVLARNQVSIYPTVAGKLAEARRGIGDRVNRGDVVAMVDPSRPGEFYSLSPVVSTISGTVLQAPFSAGDTLSTGSAVYVVGDLSELVVETFVPERFTTAVRQGLAAQVSFEALPGEIFPAAVDEVSPVLDPASRTMKIRLRFTGWADPRIRAGMFATVSLVTNTRSSVPVIPRGAVINTYGSWIVFTVDDEQTARRRSVTLGLENETFIEVSGGLEEGELVVTAGQNFLSDRDPVRIIE